METKVYILICPIKNKIRYIGITSEKYLSKRLGGHLYDAVNRNGSSHNHNWIRSLYSKGLRPLIRLLTTCDSWENARKLELSLIKKYKKSHNLTNTNDEAKFSAGGKKSARVHLTKPIYLYDENGTFVSSFKSTEELCIHMNISKLTAKKILSRKKRFGKNIKYKFQLSRVKVSNLPPILNIGSRSTTSPSN